MVVVTVAVVGASVVASPLAACHEVLDEAALSEVVVIGAVKLAPLPPALACGGRCLPFAGGLAAGLGFGASFCR